MCRCLKAEPSVKPDTVLSELIDLSTKIGYHQ